MPDGPDTFDTGALRARAAHLIMTGGLPSRAPARSWGGPGSGAACALCAAPIDRDQLELELEFADDDGQASGGFTCRFHTPCFDAWLQCCRDARPP